MDQQGGQEALSDEQLADGAVRSMGGESIAASFVQGDGVESTPLPADLGRWDEIKARTIGDAVQSIEEGNKDFPDEARLNTAADKMVVAAERIRRGGRSEDEIMSDPEVVRLTQRLGESRARLMTAKDLGDSAAINEYTGLIEQDEYNLTRVKESLKEGRGYDRDDYNRTRETVEDNKRINGSFEDLYNQNPDKFAKIPTEQFVASAKEYAALVAEKTQLERARRYDSGAGLIERMIATKNASEVGMTKALQGIYEKAEFCAQRGQIDKDNVAAKIAGARADSFDKTPRQVYEALLVVAQEVDEAADKIKAEIDQKIAALLADKQPAEEYQG